MSNELTTAIKAGKKINTKRLKDIAIVGGSAGTGVLGAMAVKKHDEKKLKKDEKTRFRRDILVPGAKRTLQQSAISVAPLATTIGVATKLRHKPKKDGYVYNDMKNAVKHLQEHRVFQPAQARKIAGKSLKTVAPLYVGSRAYLRDKDYKDRHEKYIGTKASASERALNAIGVPVARNLIKGKGGGLSIAMKGATPEALVQHKRRRLTKKAKNKQKQELNNKEKAAFDIVNETFEKIAALSSGEREELKVVRGKALAKARQAEKEENKAGALATIATGAGVVGAKQGANIFNEARRSGHVDGIVRRYHNTETKNVDNIKQDGLKARFALDPKNVTSVTGLSEEAKKNKVYLGKNRAVADSVGLRRQQLLENKIAPDLGTVLNAKKDQKTMKFNIPLEEYNKMNKVINPELRGATSRLHAANMAAKGQLPSPFGATEGQKKAFGKRMYKLLQEDTDTITGDISSKFVKGGKGYQKQTVKSVVNHIKKNPKLFMKGAGKAGLGLAMVGTGVTSATSNLYNSYKVGKRNEEKLKNDADIQRYNQLRKKMYTK